MTDNARIEVSFPGATLGIFSGDLQYTVYKGSNLLRQEIIASTQEPAVAYKYNGGLKGFAIGDDTKVIWRDTARAWQQYEFGGSVNQDGVGLARAGTVWPSSIPAADHWHSFRPRTNSSGPGRWRPTSVMCITARTPIPTSRSAFGNRSAKKSISLSGFQTKCGTGGSGNLGANCRISPFTMRLPEPGNGWPSTLYLSPEDSRATQQSVLAYTHDDVYKPLPGFKVLVSQFPFPSE